MNTAAIAIVLFLMFPLTIIISGFAHSRMSIWLPDANPKRDAFTERVFIALSIVLFLGFIVFTFSVIAIFSERTTVNLLIAAAIAVRSIPIAIKLFRYGSALAECEIELERRIP